MRKVVVSEFVSLDGVIEKPLWSRQLTGEEQQKYKRPARTSWSTAAEISSTR
jgi:hypothetical protein